MSSISRLWSASRQPSLKTRFWERSSSTRQNVPTFRISRGRRKRKYWTSVSRGKSKKWVWRATSAWIPLHRRRLPKGRPRSPNARKCLWICPSRTSGLLMKRMTRVLLSHCNLQRAKTAGSLKAPVKSLVKANASIQRESICQWRQAAIKITWTALTFKKATIITRTHRARLQSGRQTDLAGRLQAALLRDKIQPHRCPKSFRPSRQTIQTIKAKLS